MTGAGSRREWQRADLHVVLVHPQARSGGGRGGAGGGQLVAHRSTTPPPQIPQNAGNVSRTCAATEVALHLVAPLGFELDDRKLKRAGLDYWSWVAVCVHPSWDAFRDFYEAQPGPKRMVAYSKFGERHHASDGLFQRGGTAHWLLFGAESTGLPPEAHAAADEVVKIPMSERHVRSINLAVSVGVGVYEAMRQLDGAELPPEQRGWAQPEEEGAAGEAAAGEAVAAAAGGEGG